MTFDEILAALEVDADTANAAELLARLPLEAPLEWRLLATGLACRCLTRHPRVFGICGGQGAGKTTLARLIGKALRGAGVNSHCVSLDDFYLTRQQRMSLAVEHHPLLATRGVPGTHDVDLALGVIEGLLAGERRSVPSFDKAQDDRGPEVPVTGRVDLVIFEGWCVGARPQPASALIQACNALERDEDTDGRWRRFVNESLDDYSRLWGLLDDLLFLAVPDLEAVHRWRSQQEADLNIVNSSGVRMRNSELERFISHYERLTRWMLVDMPERAELVGYLDGAHGLSRLTARG